MLAGWGKGMLAGRGKGMLAGRGKGRGINGALGWLKVVHVFCENDHGMLFSAQDVVLSKDVRIYYVF